LGSLAMLAMFSPHYLVLSSCPHLLEAAGGMLVKGNIPYRARALSLTSPWNVNNQLSFPLLSKL